MAILIGVENMIRDFEIFHIIIHHNRGLFIFARHLASDHDFNIPEGSLFGDLPIVNYTNRFADINDESLSPDEFVFRPLNIEQYFYREFNIGQKVALNIRE